MNITLPICIIFLLSIVCKGQEKMNSQLAMIMLNKSMNFNQSQLINELNNEWKDEFQITDYSQEKGIITFISNGLNIAVSEMSAQIPQSDLDFPIQTAWYWKTAKDDIQKHKSHLIIFISGDTDKITIAKKTTILICSLLKLTNSIGVYWGSSSQVFPNEFFLNFAQSLKEGRLPVPIWVKTTGYKNQDNTFYLYTLGLKEFGQREFEIEHYKEEMNQGMFFLMDFISYVLVNGPIIKDGDTVGGNEEEKIEVKYKKSSLHPEEDVISILF